jgi:hypothetical protein
MIATYLIASAILFTLFAVCCMRPPRKDTDIYAAMLHTAFAVLGWVAVARWF